MSGGLVHLHASISDRDFCDTVCGLKCDDVDTAYRGKDLERVTCPDCLPASMAPVMRAGRVKTWADGFGRWYAAVPGDLANPRRTAREAIRRELAAREDLPRGYVVHVEPAPAEWLTTDRESRPVYREVTS